MCLFLLFYYLFMFFFFFFFFQAEDGIRDLYVTGVQTCALPIFSLPDPPESQSVTNSIAPERPMKPFGWAKSSAGASKVPQRIPFGPNAIHCCGWVCEGAKAAMKPEPSTVDSPHVIGSLAFDGTSNAIAVPDGAGTSPTHSAATPPSVPTPPSVTTSVPPPPPEPGPPHATQNASNQPAQRMPAPPQRERCASAWAGSRPRPSARRRRVH